MVFQNGGNTIQILKSQRMPSFPPSVPKHSQRWVLQTRTGMCDILSERWVLDLFNISQGSGNPAIFNPALPNPQHFTSNYLFYQPLKKKSRQILSKCRNTRKGNLSLSRDRWDFWVGKMHPNITFSFLSFPSYEFPFVDSPCYRTSTVPKLAHNHERLVCSCLEIMNDIFLRMVFQFFPFFSFFSSSTYLPMPKCEHTHFHFHS